MALLDLHLFIPHFGRKGFLRNPRDSIPIKWTGPWHPRNPLIKFLQHTRQKIPARRIFRNSHKSQLQVVTWFLKGLVVHRLFHHCATDFFSKSFNAILVGHPIQSPNHHSCSLKWAFFDLASIICRLICNY